MNDEPPQEPDGCVDQLGRMRHRNVEQREFYESRHAANNQISGHVREEAANFATNVWTSVRRRVQCARSEIGVSDTHRQLHVNWIQNLASTRVLDLGCFSGNALSLWMAERAEGYLGIDLSQSAIAELKEKLRQKGLKSARARAVDFLEVDLEADTFDLVYAKSVLHHFQYLEPVLEKLVHILEPGGAVITTDPLKTEPLNRLARAVYRPFQTDRLWEWPFTRSTFDLLQRYFVLEETQGFMGASRFAFPLLLMPFGKNLARKIGEAGHRLDQERATRPGPYLFNLCWQVSLLLRAQQQIGASDDKGNRTD